MDRDGTVELLELILAGTSRLPEAACIGHHELYDQLPGRGHSRDQLQQRRNTAAAEVCSRCPAPAASWAA